VAGLLEANNIYNTKLLVNRVRPDMIQKNDMMSVRDVQVGTGQPYRPAAGMASNRCFCACHPSTA
jgi:hypothetical protein